MSHSMEPPPPAERRPITTRDTRWARRAARTLARGRVTPNSISLAGMLAGILAGTAFVLTAHLPDQARL